MATTLDSFDASPVDGFIESRLGVRNLVIVIVEPLTPVDFLFVVITHGARAYHPLLWAQQQVEFGQDPRELIAEGAVLAREQYDRDVVVFREAFSALRTVGTVAVRVVHAPFRYDLSLNFLDPTSPDGVEQGRFASEFARLPLVPGGRDLVSPVIVVNFDNVEGMVAEEFNRIVLDAIGGFTGLRNSIAVYGSLGSLASLGIFEIEMIVSHIFDTFGEFFLRSLDWVDLSRLLEIGWRTVLPEWLQSEQVDDPPPFLFVDNVPFSWLSQVTGLMQDAFNQFGP